MRFRHPNNLVSLYAHIKELRKTDQKADQQRWRDHTEIHRRDRETLNRVETLTKQSLGDLNKRLDSLERNSSKTFGQSSQKIKQSSFNKWLIGILVALLGILITKIVWK